MTVRDDSHGEMRDESGTPRTAGDPRDPAGAPATGGAEVGGPVHLGEVLRHLLMLRTGPPPTPSPELAAIMAGAPAASSALADMSAPTARTAPSAPPARSHRRRIVVGVVIAGTMGAGFTQAAAAVDRSPFAARHPAPRHSHSSAPDQAGAQTARPHIQSRPGSVPVTERPAPARRTAGPSQPDHPPVRPGSALGRDEDGRNDGGHPRSASGTRDEDGSAPRERDGHRHNGHDRRDDPGRRGSGDRLRGED